MVVLEIDGELEAHRGFQCLCRVVLPLEISEERELDLSFSMYHSDAM